MVFTTYYTLTCCLNSHDEHYRDLQVKQWWMASGKYNLLVQVFMLAAGVILYWEAIAYNLQNEYAYFGQRAQNINKWFYSVFAVFAFFTNVYVVKACTEESEDIQEHVHQKELKQESARLEISTLEHAGVTMNTLNKAANAFKKSGAQAASAADQDNSIQMTSTFEAGANPAYPEQATAARES